MMPDIGPAGRPCRSPRDSIPHRLPWAALAIFACLSTLLIPASSARWVQVLGSSGSVHLASATPGSHTCTHSAGYWKNHVQDWPVSELFMGAERYDQRELLALLEAHPGGDASLILAYQLIAAKLNLANGVDDLCPSTVIATADDWLDDYEGKLPHHVPCNSPAGQRAVALAQTLDAFNSGTTGPGSCEQAGSALPSQAEVLCPLPSPCAETPAPTATEPANTPGPGPYLMPALTQEPLPTSAPTEPLE